MGTRWVAVRRTPETREVYATAWDRSLVKKDVEAARLGGLDPVVVDLKSACVARVASEPSCVVLDTSSEPVEILWTAGGVPRVWHCLPADASLGDDPVRALAEPLRSVLKFYKRRRDAGFDPTSPVFIADEQRFPTQVAARLSDAIEQPVLALPRPPRIPAGFRSAAYITRLLLIMRRPICKETHC